VARQNKSQESHFAATTGLIVLLLWLTGCSDKRPQLTPLTADSTILAFGDSLTRGTGTSPDNSYPAVLQTLSGIRVINAGVPGELSAAGLKRLPQLLEQYQPQLVILCHGGNDILRKHSSAATKQNIRQMVQLVRQSGAEVVLIGVPEFSIFSIESLPHYAEVAEEFDLPYEAKVLPRIVGDRTLKSDYVHPNSEGYQIMAEAIAQLLLATGALAQ
jgi:acyl-CoA thioesterase-1